MGSLDDLLSKVIADILKPDEIVFRMIEWRLGESGFEVTEAQKSQIRDKLRQNDLDGFQFLLSEEHQKKLTGSDDSHLVIDLGNEKDNEKDFDVFESRIKKAIDQATQEALHLVSDSLLEGWKSQAPSLLTLQERERLDHRALIHDVWAKPLNLLEILLSVSLEAGARFNDQHRAHAMKDFVFEAVTRLHARGCQVAAEALLLLRNGFADGAHARWRTLHEICVEAWYIAHHNNDVAERFLAHSVISDHKIALLYKDYHQILGYVPPDREELDAVTKAMNELIRRYGKPFAYDYGWAAQSMNKSRPTFFDLEKSVGLEHLRPFYKLANINVHSGSKGANFRLGSPIYNDDILVAGPSIYGLGEPGQNIAFSSHLLISTLLLTRENLDRLAFVGATSQLKNEVIWAFDEVMETQEKQQPTNI